MMYKTKNKLFICFFLVLGFFCQPIFAADVAIISGEDYTAYQNTLDGFTKGAKFSVKSYLLHGKSEDASKIIPQIQGQSPKIIVALGTKALKIAQDNFGGKPLIYTLVISPEEAGLLTCSNCCGLRVEISPSKQLELLKKLKPTVKSIGVIYNPDKTQNFINEAKLIARNMGIDLNIKEARSKIEAAALIPSFAGAIDVFWMITDAAVVNNEVFEKLLLFTIPNKILLMSPAKNFVDGGATLGLYVNYEKLGDDLADLTQSVLSGEKLISNGCIDYPRKLNIAVNAKIATKIGIDPGNALKNDAVEYNIIDK